MAPTQQDMPSSILFYIFINKLHKTPCQLETLGSKTRQHRNRRLIHKASSFELVLISLCDFLEDVGPTTEFGHGLNGL